MTKTNKEILDSLTTHFLESDPKEIARALANVILDMHRLKVYNSLPIDEQLNLISRLELNDKEFVRFAKEGPRKGEKFRVIKMNSGTEN
jgi:Fe2+ or Zn2+ uptake regulation protein